MASAAAAKTTILDIDHLLQQQHDRMLMDDGSDASPPSLKQDDVVVSKHLNHDDDDGTPRRMVMEHSIHSDRNYVMIDVRSQNSLITPKNELLAKFLEPSTDHLVHPKDDDDDDDSSPHHQHDHHHIIQADGTVATVSHATSTRRLPTEILYDQEGLRLFDEITRMKSREYYLTSCEESILQSQMHRLIPFISDGCAIVELGCGTMAKTALFLQALHQAGKKNIQFYAIDIERTSLEASIEDLISFEEQNDVDDNEKYDYFGILGSYSQALEAKVLQQIHHRPKVFLWLGSSIGNWTRQDATEFLRHFSDTAMNPFDLFMIGMDRRNDPITIARAYNDSAGISRDFGMNGLVHLNKLLSTVDNEDTNHDATAAAVGGHDAPPHTNIFNVDQFEYFAGYNETQGRHEAYFRSKKDQVLHIPAAFTPNSVPAVVELKENELINYEFSYKYSVEEIHDICDHANFHLSELLYDSSRRYSFAVLSKAAFSPVPRSQIGQAVFPTLHDFEAVWKMWNILTSRAIIQDPLEQPIHLRHPMIFYVGHIPAFADIHQSRYFQEPLTEPAYFATIFERGINPVVEDPTQCHPHSEVPDDWPDMETVRAYDVEVQNRIRRIYENLQLPVGGGGGNCTRKVSPDQHRLGRQLSVCLEHTIMHAETFIYMLVQLKRELLPQSLMPPYLRSATPSVPPPIQRAVWIPIQPNQVSSGIAHMEHKDGTSTDMTEPREIQFGWDNESPVRTYEVNTAFEAQSRPVTCYEYLQFLNTISEPDERKQLIPGSWTELVVGNNNNHNNTGGHPNKYAMLTVFGPIEVERCWNCPVALSYTLAERYRRYLQTVLGDASIRIPSEEEWVVMQSQWQNKRNGNGNDNGNNEDDRHPDIDFHNWMPASFNKDDHHHTIGSVWEWTSTVFDSYPGFVASEIYPGYSADFFDGLHNVVRGASWCTHGRLANRLRNFYQRSYPYAFIGVRFVRDHHQHRQQQTV